MAIEKKWFKYFNEKRESEQKQLEVKYGRPLTEEEKKELLPSGNSCFQIARASLVLLSKENNSLVAKYYNDPDETELSICIGIPYLFKFSLDLELKQTCYKKWFRSLYTKGLLQSTGILVDKHGMNLSWFYGSHSCDPSLNEGWHRYKSWAEIIKGDREVFEVKSKKDPYIVTKQITVPYNENYKGIVFKDNLEATIDVNFVVNDKLFVTRFKRWFPLFNQAYEVSAKGGPFIVSNTGEQNEVFSYVMGGDYMTPLDALKTPEEAIANYIVELHYRLDKGK